MKAAKAPLMLGAIVLVGALWFAWFSDAHAGAPADRDYWDYRCREATRIIVNQVIEDAPLNSERQITTTKEWGASQLQVPSSGYIMCDNGVRIPIAANR